MLVEELGRISSQFALGFGSYVDKIAYPYASTLQNGLDYIELSLTRMRCVLGATIHVYKWKNRFSEIMGDVGMVDHEKGRKQGIEYSLHLCFYH